MLDAYKEWKGSGKSRREFLERAAQIEGLYVPIFYDAEYNEDGTLKSFTPNNEYAPAVVKKQIVMDVTDAPYPMKPVVPFIKVTQDRVVLEIQRGCIRGCRFCQAGMLYRPVRERNVERLKQYAHDMLQNTGHEEISLSSLSSSDYSELKELVTYLIDEFKNKGIDVFLESLNRLNRDKNLHKNVLAFINVPGWVGDPREDLQERLKSKKSFDTPLEVPFITHWLHNMTHDQVLDMLKYLGMGNRPEDKVKVIFVPCYLDGRDGIMNKDYYDILLGQDLSVYASYYEPWGYTPLESVAFHVPTITTDLAGFGLWVNSLKNQRGINDGVEVLRRSDYNYSEVADGIKDTITLFADKTEKEVKEIRKRAAEVAEQALWKHFIQYYYEAYDIALRNAMKRQLS